MESNSIPLGKYKHYKGHICNVIGVARHSETLELLVVYTHNSDEFGKDAMWVRPLDMFLEKVELDGKEVPRFQFLNQ